MILQVQAVGRSSKLEFWSDQNWKASGDQNWTPAQRSMLTRINRPFRHLPLHIQSRSRIPFLPIVWTMLRRLARQLARPVVPGIATVATPKSTRRDKPFPSARCVTSSETTEATGDPSAPLVRLSAPAVSAECLSEAIFRQNARHDGIRRVGPGLKDIEARVLWPYREPHGIPERPRDPPLTPHELDPASELDASRDVPRQEQAQHLLVRCRTDARLSLRYEPLHPLVGDFAGFVVHVRPAPEVDVLAGDKVCVRLIVDALGLPSALHMRPNWEQRSSPSFPNIVNPSV